ncbi:esterase/lipase family protein [Streptomyces canus]|uniref:esterase/lipase family protein n=1 Tax=Streptomyces canus TaxID=58343 RepID=UPI003245DFF3
MPDLERDGRSELPYGLVLRSSEVGGRVGEVRRWAAAGTPVRDAAPGRLPEQLLADHVPEPIARLLGTAAQEAGMRPVLTVPLSDLAVPRRPVGPDRSGAPGPHLLLEAPAPPPDEGQVLLEADATGVVRWVFPGAAVRGGRTDRAAGAQTFRVPMEQFALPAGGPAADRGIVAFGVGKALHLLRFPIERAAGLAADFAVSRWEKRHRPYRLRLTTPQTFLAAGEQADNGASEGSGGQVSMGRLAELADQPFLLFVHGTFSRCRTGFRGIVDDEPLLHDLHRRYDGRVLAFDHPTVHLDPVDNARWLLEHLPADRRLTLDIVTHSRGGLVARHLSGDGLAGAGRPAPSVRMLVHVATPNAGTALAEKQRLSDLLGVFTNVLGLFPEELVSTTLEVVLEVVKHGATGVLGGLDGLAAMDPASEALSELNASTVPTEGSVRAVTSDFEPARDAALLDGLVDRLFGVGNDLVVPTEGVHRAGSYVVPHPLVVPSASAVAHSGFFRDAQVRVGLSEWLPGR